MSKRTEEDLLKDILEGARRILLYTENMEYDAFLEELKTQDAVIRNLEIIDNCILIRSIAETKFNQTIKVKTIRFSGISDRVKLTLRDYLSFCDR